MALGPRGFGLLPVAGAGGDADAVADAGFDADASADAGLDADAVADAVAGAWSTTWRRNAAHLS